MRGLRRARVGRDTRLLVIGGGQMGLLTALAGAGARAPTWRSPSRCRTRRALAAALGAAGVEPDPEAATAALAAVRPWSCSPPAPRAAWDLALAAADKGAVVQLFAPSGPGERRAFDVDDVFFRELEIQASYSAGPHDTRAALDLIAARRDPGRAASSRTASRSSGPAEALAAARSREGVKVIVTARVRAALLHAPGDLRIEDVAEPVAGPGRGRARDRRGAQLRHRREVRRAAATPRSRPTRRGSGTSSPASCERSARA